MTAKKRKAPSDKERLDWLTRRGFKLERKIFGGWGIGWRLRSMGRKVGRTLVVREAVTPRDAIDAAMKAERSKKP